MPRHPSYALISLIVYVDLILENLLRFYVISNMLSFREKSYYFRITIFYSFFIPKLKYAVVNVQNSSTTVEKTFIVLNERKWKLCKVSLLVPVAPF